MLDHSRSLCAYQLIANITQKMLAYAQQGDWDKVTSLTPAYQRAVEGLHKLGQLPRHELEARRDTMIRILNNDAAIRRLASPQLDRIGRLISNLHRQRDLVNAYHVTPS